jgi:hypothetical protein
LNWFSKNAYNLGIQHTHDWDLAYIIRICNACLSIICHYPKDLPSHEIIDLSLRRIFCHFIVGTAHIAVARSEDDVESRLQHYLNSRKNVKAFESQLEGLSQNDDRCDDDLRKKLAILLVFDFEASVKLKAWDELGTITHRIGACKALKPLQAIADILLVEQPPIKGT